MQFCPFFSRFYSYFVRRWKTFLFLKLSAATTLHFHFTFTVCTLPTTEKRWKSIDTHTWNAMYFPYLTHYLFVNHHIIINFFCLCVKKIFFCESRRKIFVWVPLYFRWVNLCRFLRRFLPFWLRFWHVSLLNCTHEGQMCVWLMEI